MCYKITTYICVANEERAKLTQELNSQKKIVVNLQRQLDTAERVPVQEVVSVVEETGLNAAPPTNNEGTCDSVVFIIQCDCVVFHSTNVTV